MYTELQITSNYSFLRGASHIEELVTQAANFGYTAVGIADRNSLAGIVRAHQRTREAGLRLIVGCRLDLQDFPSLLVYPQTRSGYAALCQVLSLGKSRGGKGCCTLGWRDVTAVCKEWIGVLIPDQVDSTLEYDLEAFAAAFRTRAYLALVLRRRPGDAARLYAHYHAAQQAKVQAVAMGDVLYHKPSRRILQDVVTCIREGCTIDKLGFRRERYADRELQTPQEMERRFSRYPDAIANTQAIVERCTFSLDELSYQYPHEIVLPGLTAQQALAKLTWQYASQKYPEGIPGKLRKQLEYELNLIAEMDYAPYFLTVHSIVSFAESKGILCQGRGSAANSAVCYILGITAIDPLESNLLFERFVSTARREPPDIDVDFEHERREEVIQWIFETYGRDRAALCATVIRYRSRGALREVGKVMNLTEDVTAALAGQVWGWSNEGVQDEHAEALNLNLEDTRLQLTLRLAKELVGFPRHLSQHPGGFVLTEDRLDTLVPIEPAAMEKRQVIEWDKDDIDVLRFMKVDVLGLGMLGCMRRAFDLLEAKRGLTYRLATVPREDSKTYEMIQRADTLGVFQIESRAQMSMLPRLKPRTFYDLVIEVAIVRPGPIQGDMVHPYLRRREDLEPPEYPVPALREVLGKTLGVPLFQEQAMKISIVCAGFTPAEADELRRSMATFKVTGGVHHFREKMISGMVRNHYPKEFAERTFKQIEGFGSYGFPESHAASFALIAYASSWIKCHHPDIFACALLNAQPMGFYAPAQIVRDAREHGISVLPVSVNDSEWDCTLEGAGNPYYALRLGLRMAKGLSAKDAKKLFGARRERPFVSPQDVQRRADIPQSSIESLAEADAFACLGLDRRAALWQAHGLQTGPLPLLAAAEFYAEPQFSLPPMKAGHEVVEDYRSIGLSLKNHPVAFLREELSSRKIVPSSHLIGIRDGQRLKVAGIVLVRQKPGSAGGTMFITLEDETGHVNLIVWQSVFEAYRRLVLSASMLICRGRLQRQSGVTHIVADSLEDASALLRSVGERDDDLRLPVTRGDEAKHGSAPDARRSRGIRVQTRDFR